MEKILVRLNKEILLNQLNSMLKKKSNVIMKFTIKGGDTKSEKRPLPSGHSGILVKALRHSHTGYSIELIEENNVKDSEPIQNGIEKRIESSRYSAVRFTCLQPKQEDVIIELLIK